MRAARLLRALMVASLVISPAVSAAGAPQASARRHRFRRAARADASTVGLGKSCRRNADCRHPRQTCLKESDFAGKPLAAGFCALPCTVIDEGMAKVGPGSPGNNLPPTQENIEATRKKPPPRCPKRYACRSAGNGVPIDLCVKQ